MKVQAAIREVSSARVGNPAIFTCAAAGEVENAAIAAADRAKGA